MTPAQQNGIVLYAIDLIQCLVSVKSIPSSLTYKLGVTQFARTYSPDRKQMDVVITFDLMRGIEPRPIDLVFTFGLRYARQGDSPMNLEELKEPMILAHALPYVREIVTNLTSRTPLGTLVISPVNTHILWEEFHGTQPQPAPVTAG
jgi:hypothetical protein